MGAISWLHCAGSGRRCERACLRISNRARAPTNTPKDAERRMFGSRSRRSSSHSWASLRTWRMRRWRLVFCMPCSRVRCSAALASSRRSCLSPTSCLLFALDGAFKTYGPLRPSRRRWGSLKRARREATRATPRQCIHSSGDHAGRASRSGSPRARPHVPRSAAPQCSSLHESPGPCAETQTLRPGAGRVRPRRATAARAESSDELN